MSATHEARRSHRDSIEIACNQRRRAVLRYLGREQSPVDFATLVEHVATRETDATTPDDRQAVRSSLAHVHLPKLEDADLVRFDRGARRVSLVDGADRRLTGARQDLLDAAGSLPALDE